MSADTATASMQACIDETFRRRKLQEEFNTAHGIIPQTVRKGLRSILESIEEKDYVELPLAAEEEEEYLPPKELQKLVTKLRKEMLAAAKELDFEKAAVLRDRIRKLETKGLELRT
jgi:excinuclease ABC subunit B